VESLDGGFSFRSRAICRLWIIKGDLVVPAEFATAKGNVDDNLDECHDR
jgi:hypothetical protein